ncbi:hypothetical protein [Streptosporangium sp. CA-115845]|uniref:hypothetical protein n=1 Tax=Streptosporangium sp. CA-115845 TaxID=3240071 RepID=UPI003D8B525B
MTVANTPWPEGVITRYLTVGGATVDLHSHRFTAKWSYRGAPYAASPDQRYEVGGFNWRCLGCDAYGREGDTYNEPGYRALDEARESAQEHAERCRAISRPELTEVIASTQDRPRRFWRGRRTATSVPVPDPGDSCRCVWQGGICVETCPGHTSDAWLSRLDARLNGEGR